MRRRGAVLALLAAAAILPTATALANPIFDGWYADPQIRCYGDEYWVFPTTSASFGQQTSFDAFSSRDMKTWTKHPRIQNAIGAGAKERGCANGTHA